MRMKTDAEPYVMPKGTGEMELAVDYDIFERTGDGRPHRPTR